MKLDEAIKHCEEVAQEQKKLCKVNDDFNFSQPKWRKCAEEHEQLAEWLKQLQKIQEIIKNWKDGTIKEKDSVYAFHKVCEVVEK